MGQKTSKGEKYENHVAFPDPNSRKYKQLTNLPNITVTQPTPIYPPESPNPFTVPPPTPRDDQSVRSYIEETPILTNSSSTNSHSPPLYAPPPPPPSIPLPEEPTKEGSWHDETTRKKFGETVLERGSTPLPPPPKNDLPPVIKKPIYYAKDKIAMFEAINTLDRNKKSYAPKKDQVIYSTTSPRTSIPRSVKSQSDTASISSKTTNDDYPIYNIISDYSFQAGKTFQTGAFPIDVNRKNFGFCGRNGSGKSTLINALRGLNNGDPQSAGRNRCDKMEPFRFIEGELQQIVLWEIPYPRTFSSSVDVFDANMGFDKFYDTHKLKLFKRLFVLIPDGAPTDEDIMFARVSMSRRTYVTFLSTKTDEDLDAENRETGKKLDQIMKKSYENSARSVFSRYLQQKAQILNTLGLLFVCAPTSRNLVSGTVGYLHYLMDEEKLLELLDLQTGCHYELESKLRKELLQTEPQISISRPSKMSIDNQTIDDKQLPNPYSVGVPTVLADAGFEIMFGTDDRIYQSLEPKTMVQRAGKTCFNYGFIGCRGVGKSALIDAMRGMSSKHPASATKIKPKAGGCERFEFDDNVLKYSVTLYELHYPKKINSYFEFIDKYNISSFTALFILVDQTPSDEDLSFAKIAWRRNTSILFLISKCDKKLAARSRSDEIPVCDLLKQRYIDKALTKFERIITENAAELRGRINVFFVSAPVFKALRNGDPRESQFVLHERAVFDFLKSRRMIAHMLDEPQEAREPHNNLDTAGIY